MRFRKAHHETASVDDLRDVSLFEGLSEKALGHVAELAEPVEAEPGAHLIEQGAVGLECFVILDGTAGVYAGSDHLATVSAGTVVGEMALIGHRPRNATVRAETPMKLLSFDVAAFKHLLEDLPEAKARIHAVLESRTGAPRQEQG
jgi:CRP/FNR family transcriptional regulator, cyclic AMP receptor protein